MSMGPCGIAWGPLGLHRAFALPTLVIVSVSVEQEALEL